MFPQISAYKGSCFIKLLSINGFYATGPSGENVAGKETEAD